MELEISIEDLLDKRRVHCGWRRRKKWDCSPSSKRFT